MNRIPGKQHNAPIRRARDRRATHLLALPTVCGLLLAIGFVYAGKQHFAAVRLGYKSEALRREKALLVEEQSRLVIEREQAATPARLESSARSLGMRPAAPAQLAENLSPEGEKAKPQHASPAMAVSPARLANR